MSEQPTDPEPAGEDADAMGEDDADVSGAGYGNHATGYEPEDRSPDETAPDGN